MVLSVYRNVASHISGQMHFADRNIQIDLIYMASYKQYIQIHMADWS